MSGVVLDEGFIVWCRNDAGKCTYGTYLKWALVVARVQRSVGARKVGRHIVELEEAVRMRYVAGGGVVYPVHTACGKQCIVIVVGVAVQVAPHAVENSSMKS